MMCFFKHTHTHIYSYGTEGCIAYMVIPSMLFVVNKGCPKTPSWVDTCACDRDGGQVN